MRSPFIVAYFDSDNRLRLLGINDEATTALRVPAEKREEYRLQMVDGTLLSLLNYRDYVRILDQCVIDGDAQIPISLERYGGGSVYFKGAFHLFPWGIHGILHPKDINWEQVGKWPEKITQISTWVSDMNKAARRAIAAFVGVGLTIPCLFLLRPSGSKPLFIRRNPVIQQAAADETLTEQDRLTLLLTQRGKDFDGPPFNALAFFRYSHDYSEQYFVTFYSQYLTDQIFVENRSRSTHHEGWRQILEAHQQYRPITILRSSLKKEHSLYQMMRLSNAAELRIYPVYKSRELVGYVSAGFLEPLDPEQNSRINRQLIELAVLVNQLL